MRLTLTTEPIPGPDVIAPVQPRVQIVVNRETMEEMRLKLCRELWQELHSQQEATPEWMSDWVSRVPAFGCNCRQHLKAYLVEHPPRFDDFAAWSVELHNAINLRLGKPIWTPPKE